MADRYQRLRLEVQTANDSGHPGRTYADLARRVVKAETKAANAAFAPMARAPAGPSVGLPAAGAPSSLPAVRQCVVTARADIQFCRPLRWCVLALDVCGSHTRRLQHILLIAGLLQHTVHRCRSSPSEILNAGFSSRV